MVNRFAFRAATRWRSMMAMPTSPQASPDWQLDSMPIYVAFPPNRHVIIKVRVFIDWVIELMAEHAPVGERGRLDRA